MFAVMNAWELAYRGAYVLTGDCGDLALLRGYNIPLNTVTAVDVDEYKAIVALEGFPDIESIHGEAGLNAKNAQYN